MLSSLSRAYKYGSRRCVQASNFNDLPQIIKVVIESEDGVEYEDKATLYHVSGTHPEAENSFQAPENVSAYHSS